MRIGRTLLMICLGAVFVGFLQGDGQWAWAPSDACAASGQCSDDKDCEGACKCEKGQCVITYTGVNPDCDCETICYAADCYYAGDILYCPPPYCETTCENCDPSITKLPCAGRTEDGCIESAKVVAPGGTTTTVRCEVEESRQTCTSETDYDQNSDPEKTVKQTCIQDSGGQVCVSEEDYNGDQKPDNVIRESSSTDGGSKDVITEHDVGANSTTDAIVSESCTQSGNVEECTYIVDDDNNVDPDFVRTERCEETDGVTHCQSFVDSDGNTTVDYVYEMEETCQQQGGKEICERKYSMGGPVLLKETTTCQQEGNAKVCYTEMDFDNNGTVDDSDTQVCIQHSCQYFSGRATVTTEGLCSDGPPPSPGHNPSRPFTMPEPLDVVINEIAWMGTVADPQDEWIELFNKTNQDIYLGGWVLMAVKPNSTESEDGFRVELQGIIPARGYYLLERPDDNTIRDLQANLTYRSELLDEGMSLLLMDPFGAVIDTANKDGGPWPGGAQFGRLLLTMERLDPYLPDLDENWASNDTITRNGHDAAGQAINGTPKERNSLTTTVGD